MWGSARLNATQISLVYTFQKSLMRTTIGVVKYSSYKDDRLSRQTDLNFLATSLLSDYINLFYGKYEVAHFGI